MVYTYRVYDATKHLSKGWGLYMNITSLSDFHISKFFNKFHLKIQNDKVDSGICWWQNYFQNYLAYEDNVAKCSKMRLGNVLKFH